MIVAFALAASACSGDSGRNGELGIDVDQPTSCELSGCVGASVDTSSGALVLDEVDLLFPSGLFGIELARSYRSDDEHAGWFGRGWSTAYETTVQVESDGHVQVVAPAGLGPLWAPESPDGWMVSGEPSVLAHDEGADLRWPSGERWSFDSSGTLVGLASPYGATVTVERPSADAIHLRSSQGVSLALTLVEGRVTGVESSDGRSTAYRYDGDLLAAVEAATGPTSYAYNADGRLVSSTSPLGTVTSIYDSGRVTEQVLPGDHRIDLAYDSEGSVIVREDGRDHIFEHDDDGRLLSRAAGDHVLFERRFDDDGRLVEEVTNGTADSPASQLARSYEGVRLKSESIDGVRTEFTYDASGRVTAATRAGERTTFAYTGATPLPTSVSLPSSGEQQLTYDHLGLVVRSVDATAVATVINRDDLGNPIALAQGERPAWSFSFDAEGNQVARVSPEGRTWTSQWRPGRLLETQEDPLSRLWTMRYDDAGRQVSSTDPSGNTTSSEYDERGRITRRMEPGGSVADFRYGVDGGIAEIVRAGDRTWRYERARHDGLETETATAPDGTRTLTIRDLAGRTLSLEHLDANGRRVQRTTNTYEFGRTIETSMFASGSTLAVTTEHDAAGRPTAITETFDGEMTRERTLGYENDHLVRIEDRSGAAATVAAVDYSYDPAGRLVVSRADGEERRAIYEQGLLTAVVGGEESGTVRYDRDARVVGIENDGGSSVTWALDDAGRPTAREVGGVRASFDWSANDQLVGYTDAAQNRWSYSYDGAGRLLRVEEPAGQLTEYEYTSGQTTRIKTSGAAEERNDSFEYLPTTGRLARAKVGATTTDLTYDAVGRVATIKAGDHEEGWAYDAAGRVVEVSNDAGSTTLHYNAADRVVAVAAPDERALTATYEDGHLTEVSTTDREAPITLARDAQGRLITISWDSEHRVDLSWGEDGSSLTLQQAATDNSPTYRLDGDRITGFADAEVAIDANVAPDGTFASLTLRDVGASAISIVDFDPSGRPEVMTSGDHRASLAYDVAGRIITVDEIDGDDQQRTTVTYGEAEWQIDGDDELVTALFAETGRARAPLPGFASNPTRPTNPFAQTLAAAGVSEVSAIEMPTPSPLDAIRAAIQRATPNVPAPTGVGDLESAAEAIAALEIYYDAPVFRLNGDQRVRLSLIDPETGDLAAENPFVDASAVGLALGTLDLLGNADRSLLERAASVVAAAVGGVVDVLSTIGRFLDDHPIGMLVTLATGLGVACGALAALCLPAGALVNLLGVISAVSSTISNISIALQTCSQFDLSTCGLAIVGGGLSALSIAASLRRGGPWRMGIATAIAAMAVSFAQGEMEPSGLPGDVRVDRDVPWSTVPRN